MSPFNEAWLGKIDDARIYDRTLSGIEIASIYAPLYATAPSPVNGATNVVLNPTLSWTAGFGATAHNVYFCTDPCNLPSYMVSDGQTETTYSPGSLQLGTTYYWQIEEISDYGNTLGEILHFTTDTGKATNPSPADSALYVPVDTALSWSAGSGASSHDLYMGTSPGSLVLVQAGVPATSFDPGGLDAGVNYYWRIDEHNVMGVATGDVWSFRTEGQIYDPVPHDMGSNVAVNPTLIWAAGIASGSQDIYFGTNFNDVNDAVLPANDFDRNGEVGFGDIEVLASQWLTDPQGSIPSADLSGDGNVNFVDLAMLATTWKDSGGAVCMGNQPVGSNSFAPGTLAQATKYYWRVDEVKGSTVYKGDVCSFWTVIPNTASFPGAEGWGATNVGGRGGRIIKVTNLNSGGDGSFAAACAASGPRIVVFEVSGVIRGDVAISNPYITIAGQTAPGAGITLEGQLKSTGFSIHDAVIRHLRVRPRMRPGSGGDAVQIGGIGTHDVILDHCSLSWGNDEIIDFYNAHHMTFQWCSIEKSDPCGHDKGVHNFAMISAADDNGAVTVHHNLFAHHYRRVPCMAPYRTDAADDFRNNVVYNCYGGLTCDGHETNVQSAINLHHNYWKRGPSCWDRIYPYATVSGLDYYIANTYFEGWGIQGHPAYWSYATTPGWVQFNNSGNVLTTPAYVPPITTHQVTDVASATALYNLILQKAGCWPRDRVTLDCINEAQTGTGSYGRDAPAAPDDAWFMDGLTPTTPPVDTDDDGMPDTWETAHSLNPNNPDDATAIVPAGASAGDRHMNYSYIEFYINELAESLVP
jgi:pectate lyase